MGITISQLSTAPSLSASDLLVIWKSADGDTRKASLSTLRTWFQENFASPEYTTEIVAPTSSGFNIQLADQTENLWLIINPTTTFAAGTVTLPAVASCFDGQQIIVTCSEQVTALTVAGNGAGVVGAPVSMAPGGFFALRFNALQDAWYCVSQSLGLTYSFSTITIDTAILDANGVEILGFNPEASAVNYVGVRNAATGDSVKVESLGSDTDVDIDIVPQGAGMVLVNGDEVVSLAATQVLSNKTLTSPTITGSPIITTAIISESTYVGHEVVLVAALGSAATPGRRKFVSDANATTFASVVAGGGANNVPVYSDGTNWRIG